MISGRTTMKDTWCESTRQEGRHCSFHTRTCPIPVDKLENYRRTIVRRPNKNNEDLKNNFRVCRTSNKRESYKDKLGQEKHGSS